MRKISESEKRNLREEIKINLENDFVESYRIWKNSLEEINSIIKNEISKNLISSPFDDGLLYTYDELCQESLNVVDDLTIYPNLDAVSISIELTNQIAYRRIYTILNYYINKNKA